MTDAETLEIMAKLNIKAQDHQDMAMRAGLAMCLESESVHNHIARAYQDAGATIEDVVGRHNE